MEIEIKAIIEKNLPAQVGDVLKERLKQAEQDDQTVKQLKIDLQSKIESIQSLNFKISEYQKNDERNSQLDKRDKELADKERSLKINELEYLLASEKDKVAFTKDVALRLVRNIDYRKSVFDSENQSGYHNGTQYIQPTPIHKSLTENKSAD